MAACRAISRNSIHVGLHFVQVDPALAEPFVQRAEGGVGEQFGQAGNGRRRASGPRAAEVDGVVAQRGLEVLPQPGDEPVNEGRELVARGLGKGGGRAADARGSWRGCCARWRGRSGSGNCSRMARARRSWVMAWGTSPRSSNRLARELSTLARPGGIVLEDLEAVLQFGLRLAEAAQLPQHDRRDSSG